MFAHRLLLSKKLSLVSKKPLKFIKQLNVTQEFSTSGSMLSSFKDNSGDQMNISLFNVKKSLKLASTQFEDGFTHLKTLCPVCDPTTEKAEDIYINKTTGNVSCITNISLDITELFQVNLYAQNAGTEQSSDSLKNSSLHHDPKRQPMNLIHTRNFSSPPKNNIKETTISISRCMKAITRS